MAAAIDTENVRARLLGVETQLNGTFVQRHEAIRVILLGVLSQQNYLLVGPPGTAKTSVIDRFTQHVNTGQKSRRFKILMGRFTQPEHIFGVLDIEAFKRGRYETVTTGMFTEAPFPILDEALKASDGCMNMLLGVLGPEREFQGRPTAVVCTGGATNWPEIDTLSNQVGALYDRFLLRCTVECVDRDNPDMRRALYRAAAQVDEYQPAVMVSVEELQDAAKDVLQVQIDDPIIDLLDSIVKRLMDSSSNSAVEVSDRRASQLQRVLQANAWLDGRSQVTLEDFSVLRHGLWTKRKDLEAVDATLGSLDAAEVKAIIELTDQGRAAYRSLKSKGFGVARVNETIEQIRKIVSDVSARLKRPVFTAQSRVIIKGAMNALYEDFKALEVKATKKPSEPATVTAEPVEPKPVRRRRASAKK